VAAVASPALILCDARGVVRCVQPNLRGELPLCGARGGAGSGKRGGGRVTRVTACARAWSTVKWSGAGGFGAP
jgi:hypothetical protein